MSNKIKEVKSVKFNSNDITNKKIDEILNELDSQKSYETKKFMPGLIVNNEPKRSTRVRSHTISYSSNYNKDPIYSSGQSGDNFNQQKPSHKKSDKTDMKKIINIKKERNNRYNEDISYSDTDFGYEDDDNEYLLEALEIKNELEEILDDSTFPLDSNIDEKISQSILEYFDTNNLAELLLSLESINLNTNDEWARLIYISISLAMQKHRPSYFSSASNLLSRLNEIGKFSNSEIVVKGFDMLLKDLHDLTLDVPDCPQLLGKFIARAVADEWLNETFLQRYRNYLENKNNKDQHSSVLSSDLKRPLVRAVSENGCRYSSSATTASSGVSSTSNSSDFLEYCQLALGKAESLLNMSHAYARLDILWSPAATAAASSHKAFIAAGGDQSSGANASSIAAQIGLCLRPTKQLTRAIKLMLKEYLDSNDSNEVDRQLRELDAPHFHHEVFYQAILLALNANTEHSKKAIKELLQQLADSCVLTPGQISTGLTKLYSALPDLKLDYPNLDHLLFRYLDECSSFITKEMLEKRPLPQINRRRFISEGCALHKNNANDI